MNWDGQNFNIKAGKITNDNINMVDLAMQNYYNRAILYFESLRGIELNRCCLNHGGLGLNISDNMPGNIEYDRLPKKRYTYFYI